MIETKLDLVLVLGNAVDRLDGVVPLEPNGEHILAVERKVVTHGHTAVGPERHLLAGSHVAPLESHLVELHDRARVRATDRRPADLRGRCDVPGHQPRRDRQHVGVVIEPEPRHVGGQQLIAVDLQPQQVLDDVHVLDPVQSSRCDAPGIGSRGRPSIERRFERGRERVDGRRIRTGPPLGRHLATAQLVDHLLEHRGMLGDAGQIDIVEPQLRGLEPFVVAGDAIAIEQLARGDVRGGLRAGRHEGPRRRHGCRGHHDSDQDYETRRHGRHSLLCAPGRPSIPASADWKTGHPAKRLAGASIPPYATANLEIHGSQETAQ